MSQELSATICSNCEKPRLKYDHYTTKCIKHSYKLCNVCIIRARGKQCPDCVLEKNGTIKNGNLSSEQKSEEHYPATNGQNKTQAQQEQISLKNKELKKLMAKLDLIQQDKSKLSNRVNTHELERAQKDVEIRNLQIEMYKSKDQSNKKLQTLKAEHQQSLNQLKSTHEKDMRKQNEKAEREFKEKLQILIIQKEELKNKLVDQKAELQRVANMEKDLLQTNFQNQKNVIILEFHKKNAQDLVKAGENQKLMKNKYEQDMKTLKSKHESQVSDLRTKIQQQKLMLVTSFNSQKQTTSFRYENKLRELQEKHASEKNQLAQTYERQKSDIRETFVEQKSGIEGLAQLKTKEYKMLVNNLATEKKNLLEEYELKSTQYKNKEQDFQKMLADKEAQILRISAQNQSLNKYIGQHDNSLDYYKKEIDDFNLYTEKNTNHMIAQFRSLDETYAEPTPEKLKQTQLLIRQYKDVVQSTKHPLLSKLIIDKESNLTTYIGNQMRSFDSALEQIDLKDLIYINSENGKKLKRIIEKIDLIRSLQNKNLNDSLEIHFFPRFNQKIRLLLLEQNKRIVSSNNQMSQFELIRQIDEFYVIREFLSKQFKEHLESCVSQYKLIDESIVSAFNRFNETYNRIKENQAVEKLEDYLNKAQRLKKFIQIIHHSKDYKKYTFYLEKHLKIKIEEIQKSILVILNQNKDKLRKKLNSLMVSRSYYECYLYQKIFKKLKIFDEILTKEENSYYNFNFSQLYNKILNFLKILKDEKLNLAEVIITQQKINFDELTKVYASIEFDQSVKNRYLYKIKNVLQNRTTTFSKINANTIITDKHLQQFQDYLIQALSLKDMKQLGDLPEINDQLKVFEEKVPFLISFLEFKFKEYYLKSYQFKELDQTNREIKNLSQFEKFVQQYYQKQHQGFKKNMLSGNYSYLPQPQNKNECAYQLLLKLNNNNRNALSQMLNSPEEPLKDEYFQFYTNMVTYLPKLEGNNIQSKLHKSILESISQLEAKEWSEGQMNSQFERKLMLKLNKLQNKEIAFYRELTNIHKNKIVEERQRLINSEKRKLKQDDFQKLQSFLNQCKKHQESNSKFYKLYINILEDYMNYSYDNISNDNEKKCIFINKLYKLKLSKMSKSAKDIFKSKEHKIYFCSPQLGAIRNNIVVIEKFEGQNESNIPKVSQALINAFKLYNIFRSYEENSLLEDKQKQKFHQEIGLIKVEVTNNFLKLCTNLDHEKIFDERCDRKKLFLDLIKIEIYAKLMKKIQEYNPHHQYYGLKAKYDEITKKINTKIEKAYEEVKQFRFYKDQLKLQYDNNHFLLDHLLKIERIVEIYKDIKYNLYKFEDYLKNNYLQEIHLKNINHKEVIKIVDMSWKREYANIKREITEMFHNHHINIVLKYKMILHEKEIVKNENLLSFNEIIKEEYDFKKIVIEELMKIESNLERNVHNIEKDYEMFSATIKKMEEKKKHYVETEKYKIKHKYERLIEEIKNSFHQIDQEELRQQKIQAEINTLTNQSKAEQEKVLNQEAGKIQTLRKKFNQKSDNTIHKFFELVLTIKSVQSNFDHEIEELCKKIMVKIQYQIDKFDKNLKNTFLNYVKKSKNSDMIIGATSMNLFKQVNEEQFQLNTKAMNDIHQIIQKCPQTMKNQSQKKKIVVAYQQYQIQLQRVQKDYYETKSENNVLQLIRQTKLRAKELNPSIIIARIFAVYAIYRNIDSHQEEITFDGNPHVAQIVAILLLIDAQNQQNSKLDSRLIEVKTGQGKSRVLGGLNCYLALRGFDVYCGCYSSYLSQRDEEEFHALFTRFGVQKSITYGPFSEHCQSVFNEGNKYNFKEITKKVLLNEKLNNLQLDYLQRLNRLLRRTNRVNRILVIDEVDVFFDQSYFGQLYAPGVAIDSPEVKKLIQFIWENHTDKKLNRITFSSVEYNNLINLYPHLNQLVKNQVESMIHACNNYNVHPYEIRNNEIQYVDNDSVNTKLNFGYSTVFASCFQYERGKISEENYNKNTNISLIIGQFSYAELPKYFDHIMGVSGTVEAMSDFRKKIMREDYLVTDIYTLPSIYGDSHRQIIGFHACKQNEYLEYLLNRIHVIRKTGRPILVFFENEEKLHLVSNSSQFNQFTSSIYKVTEKMPPEMRNPLINYAGTRNRITLISSAFSRGTDFLVYDSQINENGGMHVIQTYVSKNQSDFIQILGRTGRQGKNGSFEMIVTREDLEKNQIPSVEDQYLLEEIKKSWKVHDVKHGVELTNSIKKARVEHEATFDVVSNLGRDNQKLVNSVMKLNYNEIKSETIKTVIAIDGTGSMGAALNAVLNILNDTISRCDEIINMKLPNVSFEHKIMIYRNYNIKPMERILEQSDFSKNPEYLKAFMTNIKPEGGLGNEAHQIFFYELGKTMEFDKIDQIIVIGDAPANKIEQMVKHRKKFHGESLWSTKYPLLPSIESYSQTVREASIPIHSFYIMRKKQEEESVKWDNMVKQYFEELSNSTKGLFDELNIRDPEKAKQQLTDFISERVLDLVGGRDLVALYSQMYSKRYV